MGQGVPVVDLSQLDASTVGSPDVLASIRDAGEHVGALQLEGHGVPLELIAEFETKIDRLLSLPREEKARFASPTGHPYRGWRQWPDSSGRLELERYFLDRFDDENDALAHGVAEDHAAVYQHPNIWPDSFDPTIKPLFKRYRNEVLLLADRLLALIEGALGVPEGSLSWDGPDSTSACVNEYPTWTWPGPGDPEAPKLLLLEHTDSNVFTFLHQQGEYEGLQVKDVDGRWTSVPIIPSALLVIFGRSLEALTDGRWRAGRHRVVAGGHHKRRSISFFYDPPLNTEVAPIPDLVTSDGPHYEPSRVFDVKQAQVEEYLHSYARPAQLEAWREGTTYVAEVLDP